MNRYGLFPAGLCLLVTSLAATQSTAQVFVDPGQSVSFTEASRCEGTPFSDTLLKGTNSFCDPTLKQAEAACVMSVGAIKTQVESFSSVITDFGVPAGESGGTVLDATVSADVEWNGVLFGASVIGGGASVEIEMFLVDDFTGIVTGKTTIEKKEQDSTGLEGIDVGGTVFTGNSKVSFPAKVTRGNAHSIHLKLTTKAKSGLVGLDVGSIFMNNVFGLGLGDRYVRWTSLSIAVEQDLSETLARIEGKIDELDDKVEALDAKLSTMDGKLNEIILLLLTPQGLRSTDVLVCDGESCDFPHKEDQGQGNDDKGKQDDD